MANDEKQLVHVKECCYFEITLRRLSVKWCHLWKSNGALG